MAGPLKTLFGALQSSIFMNGVTLVFGNEEINTQRYQMPMIVMIPRGGPFDETGYAANLDIGVERILDNAESIEFWIWASSTDPANQGAIDHADAIETLRQLFLCALQDQRAQYTDVASVNFGLKVFIRNGRWEYIAGNAVSKYGRAYVVTVDVVIPIPTVIPQEATITSFALSQTFVDKPAG